MYFTDDKSELINTTQYHSKTGKILKHQKLKSLPDICTCFMFLIKGIRNLPVLILLYISLLIKQFQIPEFNFF